MARGRYELFSNAQRSGYTHPGFADCYAAARPAPPAALVDVLLQLTQTSKPDLINEANTVQSNERQICAAERILRRARLVSLTAARTTPTAYEKISHQLKPDPSTR
jgi:hypothetical protein